MLLTTTSTPIEEMAITGKRGHTVARNRLSVLRRLLPAVERGEQVRSCFLDSSTLRAGVRARVDDINKAPPAKRGCTSNRESVMAGVRFLQQELQSPYQRKEAARALRAQRGSQFVPQPELLCNAELPPLSLDYTDAVELSVPASGEERGPLPLGAMVTFAPRRGCSTWRPVAMIPASWPLVLQPSAFLSIDVDRPYILADVNRETPISEIEDDVASFLRRKKGSVRLAVASGAADLQALDRTASARTADLFNVASRLAIVPTTALTTTARGSEPVTTLPLDALQRARLFARQGAGNARPGNAQHNAMVNNLAAADHSLHSEETFLPTDGDEWRKVGEHLEAVEQQAECICFNCGMLVWRRSATVKVSPTTHALSLSSHLPLIATPRPPLMPSP